MRTASLTSPSLRVPAMVRSLYMDIPGPLLAIFAAAAALGFATPNPWLTVASILVLPLFIRVLWRPGEPPVLLFAVGFQWLQVAAKVFQANTQGVSVAALSGSEKVETAIWLGLASLVVLAVGMRVGLRWLRAGDLEQVRAEAFQLSPVRIFALFFVAHFVNRLVIREIAWTVPGLAQPLLTLMSIKWILFFTLGYVVLTQRRHYAILAIAVIFAFVEGLGFFSGFKTVLFYLFIVFFSTYKSLRPRTVIIGASIVAALVLFASIWTIVKPEYRAFLNQGTGSQSVQVERSEQLGKLWELTSGLAVSDVREGMEPLFRRVAYVDYLAYTLEFVPEFQPHERGAVWGAAFQHTFMPRLLFPEKPRLPSDSEHTMKYTGLHMASDAQGTSISIGYVGDSYIDFGKWGMFIPIFFIGVLWGLMYTYFMRKAKVRVFAYAISTSVLLGAYQFEMVALKLIGGMTLTFLVFALLMKYGERPLWRLLKTSGVSQQVPQAAPSGSGRMGYGSPPPYPTAP